MPDSRGRQRVQHGVHQGGRGGGGAGLGAGREGQWIGGGWRRALDEVEIRQVGRARQAVIHEGAGEQLPGAGVVDDVLETGLPQTLSDAAMELALDRERVEHAAEIVDHGVSEDRERAGLRINLDLGDVTAVGKGRVRRTIGSVLAETGLAARRNETGLESRARNLFERDGSVGAPDDEAAVVELDIGSGGLQELARDLPRARKHRGHGRIERGAGDAERGGAAGAVPAGDPIRGALDHFDIVDREAEPRRHELREGGLVSLAVRHRAEIGARAALPGELDARRLGPTARDALDVVYEADAAQLASPRGLCAPLGEVRPIRARERRIEYPLELAAVVDQVERRLERQLRGRYQVSAAKIDDVEIEFARGGIDEGFQ